MKRRKFIKMASVGALSLTGLERLAKAMVDFDRLSPSAVVICPDGEGDYLCSSSSYKCGDNEDAFECEASLFACNRFTCNPQGGDFNCKDSFGCPKLFACEGIDPPGNAQFNCKIFGSCTPNTNFWCDDFACGNYTTTPSPPPQPPCSSQVIQT